MGADSFSSIAFGVDAKDAFSRACIAARFEHGHGGYSGTIAEKHGFTMVEVPKGMSAEKCIQLGEEYHPGYSDDPRSKESFGCRMKDGKLINRRVSEKQKQIARRFGKLFVDKWDDAGCCELKGAAKSAVRERMERRGMKRGQRVFVFFGLASS